MKIINLFKRKKTKFNIVQGDITKLGYECIVNAANSRLQKGGGVCGSIYHAAGDMLEWETDKLDPIEPGQAVVTLGYDIPNCNHIVHAVGPIYDPFTPLEEQNLVLINAYENALDSAHLHRVKQIAFPLISTGIFGYPKKEAIGIAINTIKEYIERNPTHFDQIDIVCFMDEDFKMTKDLNK